MAYIILEMVLTKESKTLQGNMDI